MYETGPADSAGMSARLVAKRNVRVFPECFLAALRNLEESSFVFLARLFSVIPVADDIKEGTLSDGKVF
ncbi:MAG: hypothetical protein C6P35_17115 [Cohnella sp.]|nr:MAG: hypothetical protein C6P35_17115 [Cohnella sp.]